MAGRNGKITLRGGTWRNVEWHQLKLVGSRRVTIREHIFADAAQEVNKDRSLLVPVGVQTDAALLLEDATVVTERVKRVPGEIALEFPGHNSLLGSVKDASVHGCGHKFLKSCLQIGFALWLKKIVKDAHFGFIVSAGADFNSTQVRELAVSRHAVASAIELRL